MHMAGSSETNANEFVIAAKGAPEAIIDLCHLSPDRATAIRAKVTWSPARVSAQRPRCALDRLQVELLAGQGQRLRGICCARFTTDDADKLPGIQHDYDFEFMARWARVRTVSST